MVYNSSGDDAVCQNITFEQLLAMQSGIVESLNCGYADNSPFVDYCFDTCAEYAYYQGSISYYISI